MTVSEFIAKYGIRMEATSRDDGPTDNARSTGESRWLCEFWLECVDGQPPHRSGRFACFALRGAAQSEPPRIEHVLERLAGDARTVLQIHTFQEWAEELGVDPDSRREERNYKEVRSQTRQLKSWLGARAFRELLETP